MPLEESEVDMYDDDSTFIAHAQTVPELGEKFTTPVIKIFD